MSSFWPTRTVFDGMLLLVEGILSGGFSVKRCSPPSGSMLLSCCDNGRGAPFDKRVPESMTSMSLTPAFFSGSSTLRKYCQLCCLVPLVFWFVPGKCGSVTLSSVRIDCHLSSERVVKLPFGLVC